MKTPILPIILPAERCKDKKTSKIYPNGYNCTINTIKNTLSGIIYIIIIKIIPEMV